LSDDEEPPLQRRIAWFVGLWVGGVAAIAVVAGVIRYFLN
jgi:hypothetical protein